MTGKNSRQQVSNLNLASKDRLKAQTKQYQYGTKMQDTLFIIISVASLQPCQQITLP